MNLTQRLAKHGYELVPPPDPKRNNPKLRVYTNGHLYLGFQKIGNVYRVDIQSILMGIIPGEKALDNQIVPREELSALVDNLMGETKQPDQPTTPTEETP